MAGTSGIASSNFLGRIKTFWGKLSYFRREKVFCLGHLFSKHKMTKYTNNLGSMVFRSPWLSLWLESCHAIPLRTKAALEMMVAKWFSSFAKTDKTPELQIHYHWQFSVMTRT